MESNAATKWSKNSFYSNTNPFYANPKGLVGECTWYAWGRAHETTGTTKLPISGAGSWYEDAEKKNLPLTKSHEVPLSWSIGCFTGHVLFIESVRTNQQTGKVEITFSEANWYPKDDSRRSDGKCDPHPNGTDGELKTMDFEDFKNRSGGGTYLGSIVLTQPSK